MKILLLGQIPPQFYFDRGDSLFPPYQAQTYWLRALRELGHNVQTFVTSNHPFFPNSLSASSHLMAHRLTPRLLSRYRLVRNRYYSFFPDNHLRSFFLKQIIDAFKPELILFTGGISELVSAPLKHAHAKRIPTILLHGVNPTQGMTQFEADHIKLFDLVVTNDPGHPKLWRRFGARRSLALPYAAADPSVYFPQPQKNSPIPIVFIGGLEPQRQELLLHLVKANLKFKLFGYLPPGVSLHPKLKTHFHPPVWGKDAAAIYSNSQIALNLVVDSMPQGGNMRTFEIPATNTFQLTNRCPQQWFTPDKEIVLFNSPQEIVAKINYYLARPYKLKQIAKAGYQRTLKEHTYTHRFAKLLSLI